jgi:N-acylneuraminate cytidylyltransferase/CMP-N,N'-diacetyllegionaminic acid synthase
VYTLVTICARGGSTGLPGKNIRPLAGHPLLAWTIAVARAWPRADRVIVSTDDPAIADVARAYGAEVPFLRPAELATSTAGKLPVIQHATEWVEAERGRPVDFVVDLDPTSPVRTVADVEACWRAVQEPDTDVVLSVTPARKSPYFNMIEVVDGYARLSKPLERRLVRRQDAPQVWDANASIYAFRRDHLMHDGRVVGVRSRIHPMAPVSAHDIDAEIDFAFVEFLLETGRVQLVPPRPVPPAS